ncbi:MAG: OmpA family protein [Pseudomonadota bacterium]
MRIFFKVSIIFAFLLSLFPETGRAQSDADLCEDIFKKYRVRSDLCDTNEKQDIEDTQLSQRILESHIFFEGGTTLSPAAQAQLETLVAVLETSLLKQACVRIIGHSDTSGPAEGNREISLKRAQMVAAYLAENLNDRDRILEILAAGEDTPLEGIPGSSKRNRRAEIQLKTCDTYTFALR